GPVGVQSMNSGLLEGVDLADRIADIHLGRSAGDALADYGTRWTGAWRTMLDLDHTLDGSSATDPWVKREAARILPCIPATGSELETLLGQLGIRFVRPSKG